MHKRSKGGGKILIIGGEPAAGALTGCNRRRGPTSEGVAVNSNLSMSPKEYGSQRAQAAAGKSRLTGILSK